MRRAAYYEQACRQLSLIVFLLFLFLFLLGGLLYYQPRLFAGSQYFPTQLDGQPIVEKDLADPLYSDGQVSQWAEEAMVRIYAFDFVNYRRRLQEVRDYFTARGHQDFLRALTASNNLEAVKKKKYVVSLKTSGPTQMLNSDRVTSSQGSQWWGKPQQVYRWIVRTPVVLTYENANKETLEQKGTVTTRLSRVSNVEYVAAIAIAQIVFEEHEDQPIDQAGSL